jgi:hypothetical protein
MTINFTLIKELGLSKDAVLVLFAAQQNRINDESTTLEEFKELVRHLYDLGLLENVKRKNQAQNLYSLIRISPKGKKILEDVTTPEVTLGDCKMKDFLCDMYIYFTVPETGEKIIRDPDRKIGNKKQVGLNCCLLRNYLGLSLHEFYWLCDLFIEDYKFTKVLEYIFFNPKDHKYGKFKDHINSSPLYQFWEEKEQEVRNYWKLKIKE